MRLAKHESSFKAFFDFIYDGLVIKDARLFLDKNNKFQIKMPHRVDKNREKHPVCFFKSDPEESIEPLKYLAEQKYNQIIAEKINTQI